MNENTKSKSPRSTIKAQRPRRLRKNAAVRGAVTETHLSAAHLVQPLFIANQSQSITSMPGQERLDLKNLKVKVKVLQDLGLFGVALFSKIDESLKDAQATYALKDNLYFEAIELIKKEAPALQVITDVALDPYADTGHDGLLGSDGRILNDETCEVLSAMALKHAQAGADFIAPSDMMDGRVGKIRKALESEGMDDVGIISYSAKYASCLYGPFREALDSAPKSGDKKTYQMDPANSKEAVKEALLDVQEGADFIMVKPAGFYLDVIQKISQEIYLPVAAYQVSGEYSMLSAAFEKGWLDRKLSIHESLISIRRAGAQLIFTYFAEEWAQSQRE